MIIDYLFNTTTSTKFLTVILIGIKVQPFGGVVSEHPSANSKRQLKAVRINRT